MASTEMKETIHGNTGVRLLVDRITIAVVISLAMFIFMRMIPFLPGNSPTDRESSIFLVALVAMGIGVLTFFGRASIASIISWLIVVASILWHLLNIGFLTLLDPRIASGYMVLSLSVLAIVGGFIIFSLGVARREPLIFVISALALSITLTPYYYIAIPIMLLPIILIRDVRISLLVICVIAVFLPFLFVENSIALSQDREFLNAMRTGDAQRILNFVVSYMPNIFTYMSNTASYIRDIGPLPASDPIGILLSQYNRIYSIYSNISSSSASPAPTGGSEISASALSQLFGLLVIHTAMISKLAIALIAFAVVIAIASTTSYYIPKLIKRIPALEEKTDVIDVISPAITLVLGSMVFLILFIGVAPPLRLKTSLADQPLNPFSMVLVSGLIGGVFASREYLIKSVEATAIARQRLAKRLDDLSLLVNEVSKDIVSVSSTISDIDVKNEEGKIEEAKAFLNDTRSRLNYAGLDVLKSLEDRASTYYDEVQKVRGSLKNKAINKLGVLRALANRGNNQLSSLGFGSPFPEPEDVSVDSSLEKILEVYKGYISILRGALEASYGSYLASLDSIARMMPQESLLKPSTSPLSLYDLGERSEALNMVIELWIRLTEIYWEKVKEGLRVIAKYLAEISSYSDQELGTMFNKLSEEFSSLTSSPPVRAPDAERLLRETMDLSYKAIERIKLDLEYIGDLARDLAPEASRVIKFGVLQEIKDLEELSKKVQEFDGSILSAQEILKSLTSLLSIHRSNMRQDEEKIVLLVAYPIAKSIIEEKLSIASRISITELPFSLHASSFYARMYSETSKRTEYIEYLGVIEVKGQGGGDHSG
ncbi:MAG: hypothetical protein RQ885_12240 [Desulfurococcales archaeon]|nr:hypothetical protein [Desulfurococcales archaeon]